MGHSDVTWAHWGATNSFSFPFSHVKNNNSCLAANLRGHTIFLCSLVGRLLNHDSVVEGCQPLMMDDGIFHCPNPKSIKISFKFLSGLCLQEKIPSFEQTTSVVFFLDSCLNCKTYSVQACQFHIEAKCNSKRFSVLSFWCCGFQSFIASLLEQSHSPLLKPLLFLFTISQNWQEGDTHLIKGIGVSQVFFSPFQHRRTDKKQKEKLHQFPSLGRSFSLSFHFHFHPWFLTLVPQNCWNWLLKYLCFNNLSASGWCVKR